ncbi:MAG: hypothetical protein ABIL86_07825 [candidate division WOR-3 bacterium]
MQKKKEVKLFVKLMTGLISVILIFIPGYGALRAVVAEMIGDES